MPRCANTALNITTYIAGRNQATHPNVVSFREPWHGYRFYMAYTTYPYANGSEENPCLAASNDLLHWEKPSGLVNPVACCEETECDELKDTHLLYNEVTEKLEIWYLGRIASTQESEGPLYCFRKTSSDGIQWSPRETMFCFDGFNLASETVLFDKDTGYRFWGIRNSDEEKGLFYKESLNGYDWSAYKKCTIPDCNQTDIWHGTVTIIDGLYYFVWVGKSGVQKNRIYLSTSSDGIVFSGPKQILQNDTGWAFLYRPVLIREEGLFYCFYGVVRKDGKWLIALSAGKTLDTLEGVFIQDPSFTLKERISSTPKMQVKSILNKLRQAFVPRMSPLALLSLLLQLIFKSTAVNLFCSILIATAVCRAFISKENCLRTGAVMGTLCSSISLLMIQITIEMIHFFE